MSTLDDELTRLYKIRKTVMQMLNDRGYLVTEEESTRLTKKAFIDKYGADMKREDLVIKKHKRDNESDQIYVFFPEEPKVGVKTVKNYTSRMREDDVYKAVVVVKLSMSPFAKTCVNEISTKFHMEVFQEAELLVNVSDHDLVPKHLVLTNEEKKELLNTYTVKDTQLPRILVNDPVARYYGLKRGQVVKIFRKSETAGQYITYRYVV